jgi:uncharacterized protein YqeY
LLAVTSDLRSRLQADLNEARKQRDRARTLVLSTTLSDIKNREIDLRGTLPEEELLQVMNRAIKQRREAAEQMRAGGREELAEKEESEAALLLSYLPKQLSEDEVRAMIRSEIAGGANAIGPLMGKIMPRIRGRFDGKVANQIAREELTP